MVYEADNAASDLGDRVEYLERELFDKLYDLDSRIDKLENDVSYRDVYIYITVFYLIYVTSKQLNNMV